MSRLMAGVNISCINIGLPADSSLCEFGRTATAYGEQEKKTQYALQSSNSGIRRTGRPLGPRPAAHARENEVRKPSKEDRACAPRDLRPNLGAGLQRETPAFQRAPAHFYGQRPSGQQLFLASMIEQQPLSLRRVARPVF